MTALSLCLQAMEEGDLVSGVKWWWSRREDGIGRDHPPTKPGGEDSKIISRRRSNIRVNFDFFVSLSMIECVFKTSLKGCLDWHVCLFVSIQHQILDHNMGLDFTNMRAKYE